MVDANVNRSRMNAVRKDLVERCLIFFGWVVVSSSSSSSAGSFLAEGSEEARSSVMGVMTGEGGKGEGSFHLYPSSSAHKKREREKTHPEMEISRFGCDDRDLLCGRSVLHGFVGCGKGYAAH